jgi:hypothetical protein
LTQNIEFRCLSQFRSIPACLGARAAVRPGTFGQHRLEVRGPAPVIDAKIGAGIPRPEVQSNATAADG